MSVKETGGPAFPTRDYWVDGETNKHEHGITLRDYFAGQALTGLMSHDTIEYLTPEDIATRCYEKADAMIWERSK